MLQWIFIFWKWSDYRVYLFNAGITYILFEFIFEQIDMVNSYFCEFVVINCSTNKCYIHVHYCCRLILLYKELQLFHVQFKRWNLLVEKLLSHCDLVMALFSFYFRDSLPTHWKPWIWWLTRILQLAQLFLLHASACCSHPRLPPLYRQPQMANHLSIYL